MSRFLRLMTSTIALGLVLATAACGNKPEQQEAPETAKPVDPAEPANTEPAEPAEPAKTEPAEPAKAEPAAATSTGIEACDQLIEAYSKCDKIPQASRDAFLQSSEQWKKAIETGGDAAKTPIESTCKQTLDSSKESFKAMGC